MIINITRTDRDIYHFYTSTNGEIIINFATFEPIIGVSKKPLKNKPMQFDDETSNRFYLFYTNRNSNFPSRVFVENILTHYADDSTKKMFALKMLYESDIEHLTWRQFVNLIEESYPVRGIIRQQMSLHPWSKMPYSEIELIIKYQDFIYEVIKDHPSTLLDYIIINCLQYKAYRQAIKSIMSLKNNYAETKKAVMNLIGTDDETLIYDKYGINFCAFNCYPKLDRLNSKMYEVLRLIKALRLDYEIVNIERDYDYLRSLVSGLSDDEVFMKFQTAYNLKFENERYLIRVPHTYTEVCEIGNHFHNCAASYEWINFLKCGRRYLVTVYDKELQKDVVCCDIDNSLLISQYLTFNNCSVSNAELIAFRNEYQKYLRSLR